MDTLLYGELAPWYHLIDPPEDHLDEAVVFRAAFERAVPRPRTLLELGSGAGHNAVHLKAHFDCTLSDASEPMLARSRTLNPECRHVTGDMRTLRLGESFDAVLIHDAICYMSTRADLLAAVTTAFVHTRPGGAAIFVPDCVRETFVESTLLEMGDDATRSVRNTMWSWDPDPNDDTCVVEFALLLREGTNVRAVHERHTFGLFSRATWLEVLREAGFDVEPLLRPLGDGQYDQVFLGLRR